MNISILLLIGCVCLTGLILGRSVGMTLLMVALGYVFCWIYTVLQRPEDEDK